MNVLGTKGGQPPNQPFRPCDYFDLIAGTSTGGSVESFRCLCLRSHIQAYRCDARDPSNGHRDLHRRIFGYRARDLSGGGHNKWKRCRKTSHGR